MLKVPMSGSDITLTGSPSVGLVAAETLRDARGKKQLRLSRSVPCAGSRAASALGDLSQADSRPRADRNSSRLTRLLRFAEVTAASCLETKPWNLKYSTCPGGSVLLPCGFQECSMPQCHRGMSPWELCQCWLGWGLALLPQSGSRWGVSHPSLVCK